MSAASEKSPSIIGVYFYALLMALLGALLGFVYMMAFPAQAFSSQADYEASLAELQEAEARIAEPKPAPMAEPKPGDAYYIEGPVLSTRSWEGKRALLAAPGAQTVKFAAGEINAWMGASFRSGISSDDGDDSNILIVPGVPNIGFADKGDIFVNLPTTISAFGASDEFTVSIRCALVMNQLHIRSVSLSSAKVPLPDVLGVEIVEFLIQSYQASEEYQMIYDAYMRADSIELVGEQLIVKLR